MIRFLFIFCICTCVWVMPLLVNAQDQNIQYTPLVTLPVNFGGTGTDGQNTTEDYVRILYALSITVAGLLAVVKIILGGVQYMLTDIITSKEQAKKDIQGALLGLLIVIGAVLILNTINPQITKLNLFGNAPGLNIELGNHPGGSLDAQTLPDAEIGDSINTKLATPEQVAHFNLTCPGFINLHVDGGTGNAGISTCDREEDVVSTQTTFTCSGNICTCTHTNQRGLCMNACQTNPPEGMSFLSAQDTNTNTLTCAYYTQSNSSACSSTPLVSCLDAEAECIPNPELVCRTQDTGLSTTYYGYKVN